MESVKEHYERLLARHYTWMFGKAFEDKVAEQRTILEEALQLSGIVARGGTAVDLGSGPGYQSVALAELGFSPVIAIDSSAALLNELRGHACDLPIRAIEDDILRVDKHVLPQSTQVVVCMGDTITHLEDRSAVLNFLRSVSKTLVPGGIIVLSYRDLTNELRGADRFIPVHSDDERILTCFLEFDAPESVMVHDIVYTRENSGWNFAKGSYRKLRLSADWLGTAISSLGFEVSHGSAGRLARIIGKKQ